MSRIKIFEEIKSGYLMSQIKIFDEIFMEIKYGFKRKFSTIKATFYKHDWRLSYKSIKIFKKILKHKNKKGTIRHFKVSLQTIT